MKSEKKRGLGRGLSALMSDVSLERDGETQEVAANPMSLPIEWVQPNPDQPRKRFVEEDMADLVASVSEKGVLQPLIVRQTGEDQYQIVAGERRWRAAQAAQLHQVPVVVREFTDTEVLEIAIIENVQRSDLNAIEEASGYRQLMDRFGHTQEKLAEALGKSRSYIANLLRLLQLPEPVQTLVEGGQLSAGHARALITADRPEELAAQIVREGLSVRAAEKLVKAAGEGNSVSTRRRRPPEKDADSRALEADLSAVLKMRVTLDHRPDGEGGTLSIQYRSLDQLDDLCQKLGS